MSVIVYQADLQLIAAAYTAGLAGYLWSLQRAGRATNSPAFPKINKLTLTAKDLKEYIIDLAWVRTTASTTRGFVGTDVITQPNGIFNGLTKTQLVEACLLRPFTPAKLRRSFELGASCTPFIEQETLCWNKANYQSDLHPDIHSSIHESVVTKFALDFCASAENAGDIVYNPSDFPTKSRGYTQSYSHDNMPYDFQVRWNDGCEIGAPAQNASFPLSAGSTADVHANCATIMLNNFSKCKGTSIMIWT